MTNEWIRHADTKTGVALAFVAATAGLGYNVVDDFTNWTLLLVVAVAGLVVALLVAAIHAWLALFPRLGDGTARSAAAAGTSLIYFGDIARAYSDDPVGFHTHFAELLGDPGTVVYQVADQVGVNAGIARTKFEHSRRAIAFEFAAAALLVAVVVIAAAGW